MMHTDFLDMVKGLKDEYIERKQHLRLMLGAFTGQDPRMLMPLPGDWNHVEKPWDVDTKVKTALKSGLLTKDEVERYMKHGSR